MNEQALESFIALCDDMMVPVQEGLKLDAKDMIAKIKEALNRMLIRFKELVAKIKNKLSKTHTENTTPVSTELATVSTADVEKYIRSMYEINNLATNFKVEIIKYISATKDVAITAIKTGTIDSNYKTSYNNAEAIIEKIYAIINNMPNVPSSDLNQNKKYIEISEKLLNSYDDYTGTIYKKGAEVVDSILKMAQIANNSRSNLVYPIANGILSIMGKYVNTMSDVFKL